MFRVPLLDATHHATGLQAELRLLELHHAPELFALVDANRQHLRTWMTWADSTRSQEDTEMFLVSQLDMFASGEGLSAGIWAQGRLAGVIGTLKISQLDRRVEIGYWIAQNWEGKGLVTESARLLVDYLFRERGLNRVEIRCAVENVRSNGVPKRLGFALEGVERGSHLVLGRFHDMNRWAMLAGDWKSDR